jgi:hypothetical protein
MNVIYNKFRKLNLEYNIKSRRFKPIEETTEKHHLLVLDDNSTKK